MIDPQDREEDEAEEREPDDIVSSPDVAYEYGYYL